MASLLKYPATVYISQRDPQPYGVAFSTTNMTVALLKVGLMELQDTNGLAFDTDQLVRVTVNLTKSICSTTGKAVLQHAAADNLPREYRDLVLADVPKMVETLKIENVKPLELVMDVTYTSVFVNIPGHLSIFLVSELFDIVEAFTAPPKVGAAGQPAQSLVQKTSTHFNRFVSAVVLGASLHGIGCLFSPAVMNVAGIVGETLPYVLL